jgi:type II secretory pathway pseudopilin PulG
VPHMPVIRRFRDPSDRGFTLVEVCWVTLIAGVVATTAVTRVQGWTDAHDHSGTAAQIQGLFREAQQKAVTEGRTMCVDFDVVAQTYSMYRGSCDDPAKVVLQGPMRPQGTKTRLSSPSFNGPGGISTGATFAPRGTAWPGSVRVIRTDGAKIWTLSLEGLTGRVSRA